MDFEERYRIIQSRDPRFDGQFITAVRSTGIYCRPSCPARTPRAANVTFYETSAAAHEAGYRACKRCLPEAVPGTPAWNLRDDLTARAMRLIADGVIERDGVDGLARRLGYSTRHLTRVLVQELGAGPLALARAHRAQTARTLLTATSLPIADIAFGAGFRSVRQFNDTVGEVFRLTPSEIRGRATDAGAPSVPGGLTLSLPVREPFDAAGVFAWLAVRAVPGVEIAGADHYTRSLRLPGGPAWFTVRSVRSVGSPGSGERMPGASARGGGARLELEAHLSVLSDLPVLVARIRRLFDLDADPAAVDDALLAACERLAAGEGAVGAGGTDAVVPAAGALALAERIRSVPGIRLPGAVDPHEMVFRAILGQQITVAAARTLLHRLAVAAGTPIETDGGPTLLFPTAAQIAEHAESVLTGPRAKIATVVAVARALADGSLDLSPGDDAAAQHATLTALPGIGDWTAGYLAMRILGAPDQLLTGDVAVRSGARALGLPDAPRELSAWAASFAPWRSYLCLHLWRAAAEAPPAPRAPRSPRA
ncbi:MAG: Ada metal-binding domain-containing protein, partial [Herbiconiux sp.]|nr:Ada metal-binding domain-containing protein [Herbiconiux sp.]